MIRRSVLEWGSLTYGDGPSEIPAHYADSLVAVARASSLQGARKDGILEHGRKAIRAQGVVGVIATNNCQLEILPKIGVSDDDSTNLSDVRSRLVHMLSVVYDLPTDGGAVTKLDWQTHTLLDIFTRLFCAKLSNALRRGMPRQYVRCQEDLAVLRGRLNVTRQFSSLAFSPHKIACEFDALSADSALNQIMRATVRKLLDLSNSPDTMQVLRELSLAYADVSDVAPRLLPWDKIVLGRSVHYWRDLLSLARLILSGSYQQTTAGDRSGYSLLFEMNVLFERYIARMLRSALSGSSFAVTEQGGLLNCLFEGATGRFQTKPDLIVRRGAENAIVIDTKWKSLVPEAIDPKRGVTQADVYQLVAYNRLYKSSCVMLLYPHMPTLGPTCLLQKYSIGAQASADSLFVATVDLCRPAIEQKKQLLGLVQACLQSGETSAESAYARSA